MPDLNLTVNPTMATLFGGVFALLLLRRWKPLPLLALALVWTAVHVAIWQRPTQMVFGMLVLLATACIRLDRRRAIALGCSIAVLLYVFGLLSNDAEFADARAVIGIAWTAGAVGIADAIRSWRSYRASAEAQIRSTMLAAQAETRQQVSEERLAIARELHDLLAHNLSVMNVQTGAALHLLRTDPDTAEASLVEARDAGRTVLDELRELLSVLRQPDDADAMPTGSLPTFDELPELVQTVRRAGLTTEWSATGSPRLLAPAVSLAAYRIAQEALTNAAKHGTGTADLVTTWSSDALRIRVSNPIGPHTSATGSGLGVVGMRERATVHGGQLTTRIDNGQHTVEASLPITADSAATQEKDA
jgi:signal transduction histidine kinase